MQLFVPESDEKINPHVEKAAIEHLEQWVESNHKLLKVELDDFKNEKAKSKEERVSEVDDWKKFKVSGWHHKLEKEEDSTPVDDWKKVKVSGWHHKLEKEEDSKPAYRKNFYDSLSDEDEESDDSYKWKGVKPTIADVPMETNIQDQIVQIDNELHDEDQSKDSYTIEEIWVNGKLRFGEVSADAEDEEDDDEQVNITMVRDRINDDFVFQKKNRRFSKPKNYQNGKRNHKSFYSNDLKTQWIAMRKQMNNLVDRMDEINLDDIKYHTRKLDEICSRRNNVMNRKHQKYRSDARVTKELKKVFTKPNPMKKFWIHSVQSKTDESWLADSGASVHVTNSSEKMFNLKEDESTIVVGTGKETKATKKGDLMLVHAITKQQIHLRNVLCVPSFKQNIISIPTLMKNGFSINAKMKSFELIQNGHSIKLGKMDEKGMFYFVGRRVDKRQSMCMNTVHKKQITMDVNLAHDTFNHLGPEALRRTCKQLNIKLTGTLTPCPGCMHAKAKQKNVSKFTTVRATTPNERLFFDTSGPYPRSMGGNIYWLKVVDDFSRKNWNFLMKRKNEVAGNIIELVESMQKKGQPVKLLRCDNAGEHNPLIQYCVRNNITLEMTAPNTSQQNGVVERSFATELNYIRAMLFQANFTPTMISSLWGMAVMYLEHTKNMSSTTANSDGKSPNSLYGENTFDAGNVQPFGRIGFVTIRTKMKKKLAKRSFKAFMVGKPKHHSRDATICIIQRQDELSSVEIYNGLPSIVQVFESIWKRVFWMRICLHHFQIQLRFR